MLMYAIGVDLGTSYTAAATWRDGHAEIASLGSRAAVVPSVVLLREDGSLLTGEAAERRALTEPHRVAREFKRRLGDPTPILLSGTPYPPEQLTATLLRAVVDQVAAQEGGRPSRICLTHPANWGPYKKELYQRVVGLAELAQPVSFISEPEAAAVFYARQERTDPGAVVAVYDLGGGTFDATVLRKTATGFEILGRPEGIERLGGIDFDAAVFAHAARVLRDRLSALDEDDPAAIAAVARLREECVSAKETLSADTDTSIPVLLPDYSTEIRITRAELETMVRPALHGSIEAMRRALRSAEVSPEQLHAVLLVGGSSRIPLVAQLVGAELGRPVAVDAHPKHAVAIGAAWHAGGGPTTPAPPVRPAPPAPPVRPAPLAAVAAVAAVGAVGAASAASTPDQPAPAATEPAAATRFTASAAVPAAAPRAPTPDAETALMPADQAPPPGLLSWRHRRGLLVAVGAGLIAVLLAGVAWATDGELLGLGGDHPTPSPTPIVATASPSGTETPTPTPDEEGGGEEGTGDGYDNEYENEQTQETAPPETPPATELTATVACNAVGDFPSEWIVTWTITNPEEADVVLSSVAWSPPGATMSGIAGGAVVPAGGVLQGEQRFPSGISGEGPVEGVEVPTQASLSYQAVRSGGEGPVQDQSSSVPLVDTCSGSGGG
jgi:hypothetical protein